MITDSLPALNTIVSLSFDGVLTFDCVRNDRNVLTDFRLTALNAVARQDWGPNFGNLPGKTMSELITGREIPEPPLLQECCGRVADEGVSIRLEKRFRWSEYAPIRHYDLVITPNGNGLIITYNDITGRRTAEQAERRRTHYIQSLFDTVSCGLIYSRALRDRQGRIVDFQVEECNEAVCRMVGVSRQRMLGETMLTSDPGGKESGIFDRWVRVLQTGESQRFEFYYEPTDVWFEQTLSAYDDGVVASFTDITSLKRSEIQQANEKLRLRLILDNTDTACALCRIVRAPGQEPADLLIDTVNRAAGELVGQPAAALTGRALSQCFPSLPANPLWASLLAVAATGERFHCEDFSHPQSDRWLTLEAKREGEFVILNASETTALRRAEKQRARQTEMLEAILNNAGVGITLLEPVRDAAGTITDFCYRMTNPFNAWMVGQTVASLTGKNLLEVFPELAGTLFYRQLQEAARTGESRRFTYCPDEIGIAGHHHVTFVPVEEGILFTFLDVTQLKEAERAYQQQATLASGILEATPNAILVVRAERDPAGTLTDLRAIAINELARTWLGIGDRNPAGQRVRTLLPAVDIHPFLGRLEQVLRTGQLLKEEQQWAGRTLQVMAGPWNGDGLIITATDITEAFRYRQQLETANRELHLSNENLQSFAYIASHDLQEPLRKIQSFGGLLADQYGPWLGEEGTDLIHRMQTAAGRMSDLIRDILTFSRLSTHRQGLQAVPLDKLMADVRTDLSRLIQQTNAHLTIDPLPTLTGDERQLYQLFLNLLSNALKFTPPGQPASVRVSARQVRAADLPEDSGPVMAPAYWEISVKDAGIGFDEKYRDRIFGLFQRLHGKSAYPGTGIGLAICKRVVAYHGGLITARSKPGCGSTFLVYLPVKD